MTTDAEVEGSHLAGEGFWVKLRQLGAVAGVSWRADKVRLVASVGLGLVSEATTPFLSVGTGLLVDRRWVPGTVLLGLVVMLLVGVGRYAVLLRIRLEEQVQHQVGRDVAAGVSSLPEIDHFENPAQLKRIERLSQQTWLVGMAVPAGIMVLSAFARFLATALVLGAIQPRFLLLIPALVPLIGASAAAEVGLKRRFDRRAEDFRRAMDVFRLLADPAAEKNAAAELRVFGSAERLLQLHEEASDRVVREERVGRLVAASWQSAARLLLVAVFTYGLLGLAHGALHGTATLGATVAAIGLSTQLLGQANGIAGALNFVSWTLTGARDYIWLTRFVRTERRTPGVVLPPGELRDGIVLDRVTFRYRGTDRDVLRDLSVRLPAGAVVAVVGDNGAGKTTIGKLLLGLHQPTSGRILVDGADLATMDIAAWRQRCTAAFQEHTRPELTVGSAVGIGELAAVDDPDRVQEAANRGGAGELAADPAVQLGSRWPDGVGLSGGQWQRLAVGRSAMRAAPLLSVLDEPAAALDPQAEHALFEHYTATRHAANGAVTVLVSHRLSTVREADLILVLDGGQVVEQGSHDELTAAGGRYARLFELQSRAYR